MGMEADLRWRLVHDIGVSALADERVHWRIRPQDGALPAIVLTIVADPRPQHLEGFHALRATRVQIDCLAATYAEAIALREAAIAAVVPRTITSTTRFDRGRINMVLDQGEDTAAGYVHRHVIDATIWHGSTE